MLLLGQNRVRRGRSPLAFLVKLLILFLILDFPRTTCYLHDHISKNIQQIRNNTTNSTTKEGYGDKDIVRIARIA